jgi:hypothetical protein
VIIRYLPFTTLVVAAAGLSGPAAAQAPSTGSASIISSGGVNLLRSESPPQSAALGAVTFVLNTQVNGRMTVQLLGFIASGLVRGGMTLSGAQRSQVLTGTNMTSDALSLSLSYVSGAELDRGREASVSRSRVEVFLAQYN